MERIIFLMLVVSIFSCRPKASTAEETQVEETDPAAAEMNIPGLLRLWDTEAVLTTAESVLYDKENNLLYVSCINGVPPDKKDGDGFIARVSTNGKIKDLKWVTGLNDPKGLGQSGNTLYVADIDRLVSIDVVTGKITNTWTVEGATYLNDVHVMKDGTVFFTDSNSSTVYTLKEGKVEVVISDASLGGTNGVFVEGNTMYLAGSKSGNVYAVNLKTKAVQKMASDIPGGDGVEKYGDALMVSSWNGEVYFIAQDGEVTELLDTQEAKLNAADIEVIPEMNLLLVPTFFGNSVTAYELSKGQRAGSEER